MPQRGPLSQIDPWSEVFRHAILPDIASPVLLKDRLNIEMNAGGSEDSVQLKIVIKIKKIIACKMRLVSDADEQALDPSAADLLKFSEKARAKDHDGIETIKPLSRHSKKVIVARAAFIESEEQSQFSEVTV